MWCLLADYGTTVAARPRRGQAGYTYRRVPLKVSQLNLASSFRLLERGDLQKCRVVVADSCSGGVAADVTAAGSQEALNYHLPRFSECLRAAHALVREEAEPAALHKLVAAKKISQRSQWLAANYVNAQCTKSFR
eukprot:gene6264-6502_t